jgi:DNA-binding response OmpR family regulator
MAKILLIEDDPGILSNLIELLEMEEHEIFSAKSGSQGIEIAQERLPDLIMCDLMIPGGDGFVVLRSLRNDSTTARIPFIFLSAAADKKSLAQGLSLGADGYITKPFKSELLLNAIAQALIKKV